MACSGREFGCRGRSASCAASEDRSGCVHSIPFRNVQIHSIKTENYDKKLVSMFPIMHDLGDQLRKQYQNQKSSFSEQSKTCLVSNR